MTTMKTSMICKICGSYDDWRVIETRFGGLVFRTFLLHFIFDAGTAVFN